jgi:antitoxin component YwqK of YwqJK toxin-antitoxin module
MNISLNIAACVISVVGATLAAAAPSAAATDRPPQSATPYSQTSIVPSQLVSRGGIKLFEGKPYTGVVLDRFADGSKKMRYSLRDGKVDGVWVEWYQNGPIRFYSEWRDGRGDGPFVYFHETGEVSERVRAIGDVWDGISEGWDRDGAKMFESLYRDGKPVTKRRYDAADMIP